MKWLNLLEVQLLLTFILTSLTRISEAAIIQNPKLVNTDDAFLEIQPNGSLILRNSLNNTSNNLRDALLFKTVLRAVHLMQLQNKNIIKDLHQKIYGEGVEHKFPPFLERIIQRIQTYFSIYRYTDTSQPVWENKKSTTTRTTDTSTMEAISTPRPIINESETSFPSAVDNGFDSNNNAMQTAAISMSMSSSTIKPALGYGAVENLEDEFIEIKKRAFLANNNNNRR